MNQNVPLANWNGEQMPLSEGLVPATDRAFLFGDGVYEAIRAYNGTPWLLEEHFIRLEASLRAIQITCDLRRLRQRALATLEHAAVANALIYLQVTRGAAPRTH